MQWLTDLDRLVIKLRLHEVWLLLGHQVREVVLLETLGWEDVEGVLIVVNVQVAELIESCWA